MTGPITFDTAGQIIRGSSDDGVVRIDSGTDYNKGSYLSLHSYNYKSNAGSFQLCATDSSGNSCNLFGYGDGRLLWGGYSIERLMDKNSSDSDISRYIKLSDGIPIEWGYEAGSTGKTVTFPRPFKDETLTRICIQARSNATIYVPSKTKTTFTYNCTSSSAIEWICIGEGA